VGRKPQDGWHAVFGGRGANVIPLCKSNLHRPRACRPLASRVEEEAVRDDVRVVIRTSVLRSSVLHQVQSLCLGRGEDGWQLLCRCTRMPAQASPTPAPSRVSSPSPPQGMQAKLTTPSDPDASSSETSSSDASSSAASSRLVGSQPSLTRGRRLGSTALPLPFGATRSLLAECVIGSS